MILVGFAEGSPLRPRHDGVVVTRLEAFAALGDNSRALIDGLGGMEAHAAGAQLYDEQQPARPRFLVSGWAARVRWLSDGRRQILSFLTPGDSIGLNMRPRPLSACTAIALTQVRTLDATPLWKALRTGDPCWADLAEALATAATMEEAYLLNQVMRLGRHTAYERICHALLEIRERLEQVGLATENSLPLPVTQEMLADAMGLSIVHVNRVLQQLRRDRILDLRSGRLSLLDRKQMELISDYRPLFPFSGSRSARLSA